MADESGTKFTLPQVITAIAVSWVSMVIGYSAGYTAPAMDSLKADLNLDTDKISWISSLMPLGALPGGLLGAPLIQTLGRKYTVVLSDALFLLSYLSIYFAPSYIYLYISRTVIGISAGILSMVTPIYLTETIHPEIRGTLSLLPTVLGNFGILLCYFCGTFFEWKGITMVAVVLSVPFLVVFCLVKESPKFLLSKGKTEETGKVLQWLRGPKANINKELQELMDSQQRSDAETANLIKGLFSGNNLKPMLIVLALMLFQQWSGINAIIYYSTEIFKLSGSSIEESISTAIIGVMNFIATFIAFVLIDRLGRKVLLYISAVAMIIALEMLTAYLFYKGDQSGDYIKTYGFLPLLSLIIYVLGFSFGFGPVPWLMMGEILPTKIRSSGASIATSFNFICTFGVTKVFLYLPDLIGLPVTFFSFSMIVLVSLIFTIYFVPETRGRTLGDIEMMGESN